MVGEVPVEVQIWTWEKSEMMSSEDYTGMSDDQKKVFSDLFERQTETVESMRERLKREFDPMDKIEFFRRRKEQFKEIPK